MIDQEVHDALKVDPSPEFLARVRTRIAKEPAPSSWRWSWTFAAAAAMAAAVVVAVVLPRPQEVKPAVPQPRIAQGPAPVVSGTMAAAPTTSVKPATRRPGPLGPGVSNAFRVAVPKGRALHPDAEILLDPAETRALRRFIAGVREGRVDLAAVQQSVTYEPMALGPVADIEIPPIIIDPLTPPGGQGARQ